MGYKKIDKKVITAQANFCSELMNRLNSSLKENIDNTSEIYYYCGIHKHYQMQQDIIRLRRELQSLSKMLTPTWEPES